ncbi:MAG TPA: DUF2071 domain-containing protein [Acidimicrobiales bacterium]|nr:DUF2071 domain-containing protein [Acidimicrobiales bacterium]
MAGRLPEERVERPVTYQRWGSITFLHWRFDPAVLQPRLPEGFTPDTYDGSAWVSMTPFVMTFRVAGLPHVPGMTRFPETNVRTYVRGPDGRDGIWFFSLEAACLPLVLGARALYRVPYRWADMEVDEQGPTVRYRSRRRRGPAAGHDITIRPGAPCEGSDLDHWLSGRWRGWTHIAGRSCTVAAEHPPWALWDATVVDLDESLLAANGLVRPSEPPLVRYSPGTDARLGIPHACVFRTATGG